MLQLKQFNAIILGDVSFTLAIMNLLSKLCIFIVLCLLTKSEPILVQTMAEDVLHNCIGNILKKYNPTGFLEVIVTNLEENLVCNNIPLTRIRFSDFENYTEAFQIWQKVRLYILDFRAPNNNTTIQRILELIPHCYLQKQFYFIVSSTEEVPFEFLAKNYIENVLVFTETGSIFTYFPYKFGNIKHPDLDVIQIGSCHNTNNVSITKKETKNWKNSTLRAILRVTTPYVNGDGNGVEEKLLQLFQNQLKFNVSYEYLEFGVKQRFSSIYKAETNQIIFSAYFCTIFKAKTRIKNSGSRPIWWTFNNIGR